MSATAKTGHEPEHALLRRGGRISVVDLVAPPWEWSHVCNHDRGVEETTGEHVGDANTVPLPLQTERLHQSLHSRLLGRIDRQLRHSEVAEDDDVENIKPPGCFASDFAIEIGVSIRQHPTGPPTFYWQRRLIADLADSLLGEQTGVVVAVA
jgi:hypothetical protein